MTDFSGICAQGTRIAVIKTEKPLKALELHRRLMEISDCVLPPLRPNLFTFRIRQDKENKDD